MTAAPPAVAIRRPVARELGLERRTPTRPSAIMPGPARLEEFATVSHLAAAVARALGSRPLALHPVMATISDHDTFPAFTVHAAELEGRSTPRSSETYICTVAIQRASAEEFDRAVAAAQRRAAA